MEDLVDQAPQGLRDWLQHVTVLGPGQPGNGVAGAHPPHHNGNVGDQLVSSAVVDNKIGGGQNREHPPFEVEQGGFAELARQLLDVNELAAAHRRLNEETAHETTLGHLVAFQVNPMPGAHNAQSELRDQDPGPGQVRLDGGLRDVEGLRQVEHVQGGAGGYEFTQHVDEAFVRALGRVGGGVAHDHRPLQGLGVQAVSGARGRHHAAPVVAVGGGDVVADRARGHAQVARDLGGGHTTLGILVQDRDNVGEPCHGVLSSPL